MIDQIPTTPASVPGDLLYEAFFERPADLTELLSRTPMLEPAETRIQKVVAVSNAAWRSLKGVVGCL